MNQHANAAFLWRIISGTTTPEDAADLYVPLPPVDFRTLPSGEWREHLMRSVTLPQDVERYVSGQTQFTQEELNAIEDRLSAFHGVSAPYYITAQSEPHFDAWLGCDSHVHTHTAV